MMTPEDFAKLQAGAAKILAAKAEVDHVIADFRAKLAEKIVAFDAVCANETTVTVNQGYHERVTSQVIDEAMQRVTPRIYCLTHTINLAPGLGGHFDQ
jgi:hypothetical protein